MHDTGECRGSCGGGVLAQAHLLEPGFPNLCRVRCLSSQSSPRRRRRCGLRPYAQGPRVHFQRWDARRLLRSLTESALPLHGADPVERAHYGLDELPGLDAFVQVRLDGLDEEGLHGGHRIAGDALRTLAAGVALEALELRRVEPVHSSSAYGVRRRHHVFVG